jgi:serine/threonine protein kinase
MQVIVCIFFYLYIFLVEFGKIINNNPNETIYTVKHKKSEKLFAGRVIPLKFLNDKQNIVNILSSLQPTYSPFLVNIFGVLKIDVDICIIQEMCRTNMRIFLDEWGRNGQVMDENIMIDMVSQIVVGLQALETQGLVHGDLKIENIFFTNDVQLKLGNFGISNFLRGKKPKYIIFDIVYEEFSL